MIWVVLILSKEISGLVMTAERALPLRSVCLNNILKHTDIHKGQCQVKWSGEHLIPLVSYCCCRRYN